MKQNHHVQQFLDAVNGGKGMLDAWLECNNEEECRAAVLGAIELERNACAKRMARLGESKMTTSEDSPYWFPKLTDAAWVARVRKDYPEDTKGMGDEWVRDTYAGGYKYADTWDHLGDARHDYERLADAYLDLLKHFQE